MYVLFCGYEEGEGEGGTFCLVYGNRYGFLFFGTCELDNEDEPSFQGACSCAFLTLTFVIVQVIDRRDCLQGYDVLSFDYS